MRYFLLTEHCDESVVCNEDGFVDQNCKCICKDGSDSCTKSKQEPDGKTQKFGFGFCF